MKRIVVIIPAYNARPTIGELIRGILKFMNRGDVAVIDDGSEDQTYDLAQRTGAVILKHDRNKGKGDALKTGFRYALENKYDALITIDADLQHDPQSIPDFVRTADGPAGIVIGTRERNLKIMPFARWLTNNLTSAIVSILSGQSVRDSQSGYRLIFAQVVKNLELESEKYDLESEILIKAARKGFRIREVAIKTIYRDGRSFINPFVDTGRFIKLMWRSLWW
jgi:glycosyltransferase involved in cell wall biosynthesis